MFVLGRNHSPMLTNLVPCLWKEDHLGLTHDWYTHIFVQDLFYFHMLICTSLCIDIQLHICTCTYIYSLINLSLLVSRSVTRGPPLPFDLDFTKKVLWTHKTIALVLWILYWGMAYVTVPGPQSHFEGMVPPDDGLSNAFDSVTMTPLYCSYYCNLYAWPT